MNSGGAKSKSIEANKRGGGSSIGRGGGAKRRAIEVNKRIAFLGGSGNWRGLLCLHHGEGKGFNNVNWATLASKLGKLRAKDMGELKEDGRVSLEGWRGGQS